MTTEPGTSKLNSNIEHNWTRNKMLKPEVRPFWLWYYFCNHGSEKYMQGVWTWFYGTSS